MGVFVVVASSTAATGGLVGERRRMLLRIIVLDCVWDNPDLDILADLLPDLFALLVVVGLAHVLVVRLALLLPDLLAFLLVLALLLYGELALGDLKGVALVRQDQLAFLLVLCLAHLVGDPLAGPVLLVVAFGVVVGSRALLLPDVIVDYVAAVLARVRGPRISVRWPRIGNPGRLPGILLRFLPLLLEDGVRAGDVEQEEEDGGRDGELHGACVAVGNRV